MITFAGVALLLFGPKLIYHSIEKTIELLVGIVTIGLIVVAIAVSSLDTWKELAGGIINIVYKDPGMPVKTLFIALVFAGAGGTANLFYTFYLRDKNISMGAPFRSYRIPSVEELRRLRPPAFALMTPRRILIALRLGGAILRKIRFCSFMC